MPEITEVEASTSDESLKDVPKVKIQGPVEIEQKLGPAEPATTAEEDRHTKSARNINMIWEVTQAAIALLVVGANIAAGFISVAVTSSSMLANAFFLVIGFYFGRTNHARSGGVVEKS